MVFEEGGKVKQGLDQDGEEGEGMEIHAFEEKIGKALLVKESKGKLVWVLILTISKKGFDTSISATQQCAL